MSIDRVHRLIEERRGESLEILKTLIRQPSISAQDKGVKECAHLLSGMLREFGIPSRIVETPTNVAKVDPRVVVEARGFGTMEATRTSPEHPAVGVVAGAIRAYRGVDPYVNLSGGGSLPNAVWPNILGVDHIGVPYANADENNHSPNENLSLERFQDGIHVSAQVFQALAEADAEKRLPRGNQ